MSSIRVNYWECRRHEIFIDRRPFNLISPFMGGRTHVAPDGARGLLSVWSINISPLRG